MTIAWTRPLPRAHFLLVIVMSAIVGCAHAQLRGTEDGPATLLPGPLAFQSAANQVLRLNEPGKLYLLDFMAVGCKPCMEEMPELERLDRELGSSGSFQLVTVVCGWPAKDLNRIRGELKVGAVELYADEGGSAMKTLSVQGWPTKFLIRDGQVLLRRDGGGAGAYSIWRKIIHEHSK